jgi:hypothetical protein
MKREKKIKLRIYFAVVLLFMAFLLNMLVSCKKEPMVIEKGVLAVPSVVSAAEDTLSPLEFNRKYIVGRWLSDSIRNVNYTFPRRKIFEFTDKLFYAGNYWNLNSYREYRLLTVDSIELFNASPFRLDTFLYELKDTNTLNVYEKHYTFYLTRKEK